MARTTIMTVSTRDFVSRGAVLAVSALAHVLVYGALSLVPASTPPPRPGLIIADAFGGAVLREPPHTPLAGARRKALTLAFARLAAGRAI